MPPVETALAILVLLLTPGPTNTLLAIAGAERGWTRAVRLIPAELGGYLAITLPLALLGARLLDAQPAARTAITLLAAVWVAWLALSMWRVPAARTGAPSVTGRRVLVTTLLNPKALIFGLVLLPAADGARLLLNLGLFAAEIVAVAMAWAALGALLRRAGARGTGMPQGWRRAASVWLGALAVYLLGRVAGLA
ncbi:LysE family translocator [Rubellimicrobium roseum]|uniref:Threonine transporter RhtB n=1 Tax=Rubellimicrobium roseum TaxID=687525 RepID=A0A5C4NH20_9RHOB|nr:LysE family transporter [Rubellimicrobium roseum]TNC71977.1 hypothetical protein FHG71_09575 [Rubellimicrobium roseum]